jgi:hypothetical protein
MMKFLATCVAIASLALGTAHADLIDNGGGLIYDTAQNITWYDYQTNPMTFAQAQAWAAGLTIAGVSGWTLPSAGPSPSLGATTQANYNATTSEMGYLFYDELNDKGFFNADGSISLPGSYGLVNTGFFQNLVGGYYWTSTVYVPQAADAWYFGYTGSNFVTAATGKYAWGFDLGGGEQLVNLMTNSNSLALAIHAGDVYPLAGTAPMPPAFLLFGPCVAALAAIRRKWKHH